MKKKSLLTLVIISIFLLSGHASIALAGAKSSPVQSEIKQLEAVKKSLNKINDRLQKILDNPPGDGTPGPNVNGAVGRLSAMYSRLKILDGFIDSSVEKVLGQDDMTDVLPALKGIKEAIQGISDKIADYLAMNTEPLEFIDALNAVKEMADGMVNETTGYLAQIEPPSDPPLDCSIYSTKEDCEGADGCTWQPSIMPGSSGTCKAS